MKKIKVTKPTGQKVRSLWVEMKNAGVENCPNFRAWELLNFSDEVKTLSNKLNFTCISKRGLLCQGNSIIDCPLRSMETFLKLKLNN